MGVFKRGGAGKYYIQFNYNYNGKTYVRSSVTLLDVLDGHPSHVSNVTWTSIIKFDKSKA